MLYVLLFIGLFSQYNLVSTYAFYTAILCCSNIHVHVYATNFLLENIFIYIIPKLEKRRVVFLHAKLSGLKIFFGA